MKTLTPAQLLGILSEEYNYGIMKSEDQVYPADLQAYFIENKNAELLNQHCSFCDKLIFPRIITNSLIMGFYELGIITGHRIRNQELSKAPGISKVTKDVLLEESAILYPEVEPTMNYRVAKLVHNPVSLWLRFLAENDATVIGVCQYCNIREELCSIWNKLFIQTPNAKQFFRIAKD